MRIKEQKGSFSVIKEDLLSTHPLFCGDGFLFQGVEVMAAGRRKGGRKRGE